MKNPKEDGEFGEFMERMEEFVSPYIDRISADIDRKIKHEYVLLKAEEIAEEWPGKDVC